jgi:hypothetical protein
VIGDNHISWPKIIVAEVKKTLDAKQRLENWMASPQVDGKNALAANNAPLNR